MTHADLLVFIEDFAQCTKVQVKIKINFTAKKTL